MTTAAQEASEAGTSDNGWAGRSTMIGKGTILFSFAVILFEKWGIAGIWGVPPDSQVKFLPVTRQFERQNNAVPFFRWTP